MRKGIVLTEEKAVEIYTCKLDKSESFLRGLSVPVSQVFAVSPKTVRDIWSGRTWAYATCEMWSNEVNSTRWFSNRITYKADLSISFQAKLCRPEIIRRPGRPKGSKNSNPQDRLKGQAQVIDDLDPSIAYKSTPDNHRVLQILAKSNANQQVQMLHELAESKKYFCTPEAEKSANLNDPFHFDWPYR